jgi:cytochrome c oxidase cbb3-type subunit 2
VTREGEKPLKLTTRLLLLRPLGKKEAGQDLYELYDPEKEVAFVEGYPDPVLENWVDKDFVVLDPHNAWHALAGVIYQTNPIEFKVSKFVDQGKEYWRRDPKGAPFTSEEELKGAPYQFLSRKELIAVGEHIYQIEGCWYCHTDQTRTLVQDVTLNGSDSFPAPPSSANEYIYQQVTFPGTKRNGPDLSRTGIKRPSRDWHKAHFWAPKTQSVGSIMPAFRHFFDFDPRGTGRKTTGVPNYKFEAIFQYLMTKGTRITPPTEAWWLGKDPVNTLKIIEGRNGER